MKQRGWSKELRVTAILWFVFFWARCSTLYANSGASFLKLGVGARALGLGSAYTAVSDDVTALHWNPAGLSQMTKRELGAMHAEVFAESRYDFFGYAHPTNKGTLGVGAVYLSQGAIEGRSENREQTADFSASDLAVTIGAGRLVTKQASLGMNLKILQSKIAGFSSTGFALDFGSLYRLPTLPLSVGFSFQNIGPRMKFLDDSFNLPLTLAGGVSFNLANRLLISADLKHQPYDSRTSFSIGTEFSPVSLFSLRAGYLINAVKSVSANQKSFDEKLSNLSGLGLGVGFKLGSSAMDYSFTPAGELGNTQRISVSMRF